MMNWISKKLQINPGSYGVLTLSGSSCMRESFTMCMYSYTDCGGRHEHNNFDLTPDKAIKVASFLYKYSMSRKTKKREAVYVNQKYAARGDMKLSLEMDDKLHMEIDSGLLKLSRKQAKRVAGYLFFWAGEAFIGTISAKIPARTEKWFDINDIMLEDKIKK